MNGRSQPVNTLQKFSSLRLAVKQTIVELNA